MFMKNNNNRFCCPFLVIIQIWNHFLLIVQLPIMIIFHSNICIRYFYFWYCECLFEFWKQQCWSKFGQWTIESTQRKIKAIFSAYHAKIHPQAENIRCSLQNDQECLVSTFSCVEIGPCSTFLLSFLMKIKWYKSETTKSKTQQLKTSDSVDNTFRQDQNLIIVVNCVARWRSLYSLAS